MKADDFHIFDYVVIGLGTAGSSILYHLSKHSKNVLGLEQFNLNHNNGSSHGDTRIIRQAYFEGQFYIPLLKRAYQLWEEIEEESKEKILYKVGCLNVSKTTMKTSKGKENNYGNIVKKCKDSCDNYNIRYKLFDNGNEINDYFPYFNFKENKNGEETENYKGLLEYDGGYLKAEDCVKIHLSLAKKNGSKIFFNTKIRDIKFSKELDCYVFSYNNTEDKTLNVGNFYARKIAFACGAWINEILIQNFNFKLPLTVDLNHVYYFKILNINENLKKKIPVFIIQDDEKNEFYGFPDIGNGNYFKYSIYHQGLTHNNLNEINRNFNQENFDNVKSLCKKFIKNFRDENVELINQMTCVYTSTPDCNFVIDYLPNNNNNIVICSACSGHGFKLASAVGEHVKLLLNQQIQPLKQFKIERFGNCFTKPKF